MSSLRRIREALQDVPPVGLSGRLEEDRFRLQNGTSLIKLHSPELYKGRACVIHNQSDHNLKHLPLHWRQDRRMFERVCEHGVGHPDPDDLAFHVSQGREWMGVHGCCGCCHVTG
jgi:hypothetical protein